ncbi:Oidioi.mRNA.OKI2018_I69.chr2.g5796.t2.cds [Oikopleura dioica]|uniref:Oidioi.mRNA.OKI2018_I69.chr2.g5796.t2.cds n=1 Tax=Oikopleura dioica TaxID=34765 RepID=A0ABN7T508_OIKDI|nr:Oidioi.mRNA.OKI2018_I69.chr2.g5796.t2.cds [Oikopleura dioica]
MGKLPEEKYKGDHHVDPEGNKVSVSKKSRCRKFCCRFFAVTFGLLTTYISTILIVYKRVQKRIAIDTLDLPTQGGSDNYCDSFYVEPSSSVGPYLYDNTFDISSPIDWSDSGGENALNKFRAIGTHNSYHRQQYPGSPTYWANWWARAIPDWSYEHPPLTQQFSMGWRTLELDFHMRKKASLIYHIQMWDQLTNECTCAASCFKLINDWSEANAGHFPLFIMLEPKLLGFLEDSEAMREEITLEKLLLFEQLAIQSFGNKIVTPDALRNGKESVLASIQESGWPSVENFYGKIFFIIWKEIDNELIQLYIENTNGLEGRAFFPYQYFGNRYEGGGITPFLHMDRSSENVVEALEEGFIARIRMNTVPGLSPDDTGESDGRYEDSVNQGGNIISFDQRYDYCWELLKNDERCEVFTPAGDKNAKVCKWTYNSDQ